MERVKLEVADALAFITIDNPPVNSLSIQVIRELAQQFKDAYSRMDVKAIVLTGARSKFSGGADIKAMSTKGADSTEAAGLELVNNIIEGGTKPVVAAITGFALGGGLELAMACHARVATPDSRLGLPELQLGIIPGLGGTQRLPRLVGVVKAVHMMLASEIITAAEAHKLGLVDGVCSSNDLLQGAKDLALRISRNELPLLRTLERSEKLEPVKNSLEAIAAARLKAKKIHKHVEYPFICLDTIEYGILHGGLAGTIQERRLGVETTKSPAGKALMHVFLAERTAYKVPGISDGELKARPIRNVGVIGGGLMGSGIATALILSKVDVHLKEVDEQRLQAAFHRIEANLQRRIGKGGMSQAEFLSSMSRLRGTLKYDGFDTADIVIEAVIESIPLKQKIFREIDEICRPDCILASNTSSCDINLITEGVSHPGRIIGAHFFSPAHVMKLFEIIRTEKTSKQTIFDLLSLSRTMKKVPVVVKNTPGFAVNRVFFPYHRMALFLVDSGIHPYRIDSVIKDFGMPMGPFRLGDMAGLQIGTLVSQILTGEFGDRIYSSCLGNLLVNSNRIGEAVGKGYYNYQGTRQELPAPELDEFLEKSRSQAGLPSLAEALSDNDIVEMIFFPIFNEACRVVDEGIVIRSSDLDIASILGMGFPSFRGGLFFWGQSIGLSYILRRLQQWQNEHGSYFRPTPSLQKMVALMETPKPRL